MGRDAGGGCSPGAGDVSELVGEWEAISDGFGVGGGEGLEEAGGVRGFGVG